MDRNCFRPFSFGKYIDSLFRFRWVAGVDNELEYTDTAPNAKDMSTTQSARRTTTKTAAGCHVFFVNFEEASRKGFNPPANQGSDFASVVHCPGEPIDKPSFGDTISNTMDRLYLKTSTGFASMPKHFIDRVSVLGSGLDVRISRIPDSGRGVYATRMFDRHEIITLYCGHVFGEAQRKWLQREGLGTHSKPLTQKLTYLDGVKLALKGMHVGQLVNHSDVCANSKFVTVDLLPFTGERVIALKATRVILTGEEIYVQYGTKFWSEQGATPTQAPDFRLTQDFDDVIHTDSAIV